MTGPLPEVVVVVPACTPPDPVNPWLNGNEVALRCQCAFSRVKDLKVILGPAWLRQELLEG